MTWSLSQNVCYVAYTLSYEAQFDSKLLSFRIFHLTLHHKPTTISYFQLWDFESWRAQNYLQCNIKNSISGGDFPSTLITFEHQASLMKESVSPGLTGVLHSVAVKHDPPIERNSLICDVGMEAGLCKAVATIVSEILSPIWLI